MLTMAVHEITNFFGKLLIKDETKSCKEPPDDLLLKKIQEENKKVLSKYINLETGRSILPSSASKKKCINNEWYFCGDNEQQFERINKKLANSIEKPKQEITKKPINLRPKRKVIQRGPKVAKGDIPKRKPIPKTLRHHLWMRDYGNISESKCCCCGVTTITEPTAEAGHIIAFSKGGSNETDNLRLICRTCNTDMGTQNMDEFMRVNNFPIKLS